MLIKVHVVVSKHRLHNLWVHDAHTGLISHEKDIDATELLNIIIV
jgi:hypothetical protein